MGEREREREGVKGIKKFVKERDGGSEIEKEREKEMIKVSKRERESV